MKKLLFPVSERDYFATGTRISYLMNDLAKYFIVEVLTISNEVYDDINKKLEKPGGASSNIHVKLTEGKYAPTSYDLRNDLVKIFIRYTYDMVIPGTDMKIWKTTAIDDFLGHISGLAYPEITGSDADMILFPIMNYDEPISEEVDVFYTTLLFNAKEAGIKVAGYQVYPVFESGLLMARLMDALIVRKEFEKQFFIKNGIAPEKIWVLTDSKDIYSLSTIEDVYKNNLYNSQIEVKRSELAIAVFNHAKFRPQLRDLFRFIGHTGFPVVLFLVKRIYNIGGYTEDNVIEGIFLEEIRKIKCRFYLVEPSSAVPTVMISDVVISPSYIAPLEFSAQNGKEAWVYNPLNGPMPEVNGITFINNPDDLARSFKKAYKTKHETVGMIELLNALSGNK